MILFDINDEEDDNETKNNQENIDTVTEDIDTTTEDKTKKTKINKKKAQVIKNKLIYTYMISTVTNN